MKYARDLTRKTCQNRRRSLVCLVAFAVRPVFNSFKFKYFFIFYLLRCWPTFSSGCRCLALWGCVCVRATDFTAADYLNWSRAGCSPWTACSLSSSVLWSDVFSLFVVRYFSFKTEFSLKCESHNLILLKTFYYFFICICVCWWNFGITFICTPELNCLFIIL